MKDSEDQKAIVKKKPPLLVRLLVHSTMTGIGLIAFLYLIFPSFGVIELIPDNVPFFGNLDEASVTAILLMVAYYWGIDPTKIGTFIRKKVSGTPQLPEKTEPND